MVTLPSNKSSYSSLIESWNSVCDIETARGSGSQPEVVCFLPWGVSCSALSITLANCSFVISPPSSSNSYLIVYLGTLSKATKNKYSAKLRTPSSLASTKAKTLLLFVFMKSPISFLGL